MDSRSAIAVSAAFQIGPHAPVAICAVVAVIDALDLLLDFRLLGMILRLPVFPVVVIGIRAEPQPPQQPAGAEFFMVLVNESISL